MDLELLQAEKLSKEETEGGQRKAEMKEIVPFFEADVSEQGGTGLISPILVAMAC